MSERVDEYPLISQTKMDRLERHALTWPGTPANVKRAIVARMAAISLSPATMPREAIAAAKALLQADKLSLEVEKHRPLEQVSRAEDEGEPAKLTIQQIHRFLELGHWPEDEPIPEGWDDEAAR